MRYKTVIEFSLPYANIYGDKAELKAFIKAALESWGGQRHPEDWLFDSLQNVKVKGIKKC